VGVLSDGRLVAEGAPDDLTRQAEAESDRTLEDVFLEVTSEDPAEDAAGGAVGGGAGPATEGSPDA
jgi:ABC-2 type transport system ATP-binding protein